MKAFQIGKLGSSFGMLALLLACANEQPTSSDRSVVSALTALSKEGAPVLSSDSWGYAEHNGPENWCDLSPAYSLCCDGTAQTPLNITPEAVQHADLPALHFDYDRGVELEVEHNGHTIEAKVPAGAGALTIDAKTYGLLQFHFHPKLSAMAAR